MGHENQSAKKFDFYLCPKKIKVYMPKISKMVSSGESV